MARNAICPKVLFSTLILAGAALPGQLLGQGQQRRDHAQMQRLHNDPNAYIAMLEDPERDAYQRPEEVLRELDLQPGEVIADIGSGSGYFTIRFAAAVGETGKSYGVDISPDMILHLNRRAHEAELANLQTILAPPDDPLLSSNSADRIFICNTWHHIEAQSDYLSHIRDALKSGGQLIIIDFFKKELPIGPGLEMKIAKSDVVSSIEKAGFELIRDVTLLEYQYFLIFEVKGQR